MCVRECMHTCQSFVRSCVTVRPVMMYVFACATSTFVCVLCVNVGVYTRTSACRLCMQPGRLTIRHSLLWYVPKANEKYGS